MSMTEDKLAGRTELENYLADQVDTAITNHNITVYYQPIIRTITGKICAFEALARWDDPVYGMITPSVFLAVLEATRQTHKLDAAMVDEVCRMLAERQRNEQPGFRTVPAAVPGSRSRAARSWSSVRGPRLS